MKYTYTDSLIHSTNDVNCQTKTLQRLLVISPYRLIRKSLSYTEGLLFTFYYSFFVLSLVILSCSSSGIISLLITIKS